MLQQTVGVATLGPGSFGNPATHGAVIRQQIVEDGDQRFAGELRFAQGQRKGDRRFVLLGKPTLIVTKVDRAAGHLRRPGGLCAGPSEDVLNIRHRFARPLIDDHFQIESGEERINRG